MEAEAQATDDLRILYKLYKKSPPRDQNLSHCFFYLIHKVFRK
jgi:hypothetical protein